MEFINDTLQFIGLLTVLYFCFILYGRYKAEQQRKVEKYHRLVVLLSNSHPTISNIFNKYEADQRKSLKYAESDPDNRGNDGRISCDRGSHHKVLGKIVYSFYPHTLKGLENSVISAVSELQSTEKGRQEIMSIQDKIKLSV